jgi:hypothetical protein
MAGKLTLTIDHAQARISADRLPAVAAGEDWRDILSTTVWIEPVNNRAILRPYALTNAWYTSGTGSYAKMTKSDFGLGSDFEDRADQSAKGNWIAKKAADVDMATPAISSTTYSKNRGFYCAWFSYNTGQKFGQFQCGWNNTGGTSTGVRIDCYSDGAVEVYKDGVFVAAGSISGSSSQTVDGAAAENQVFDMVLIPYSHDELLIWSPMRGAGFSVTFEDIAEDAADPTITSATKFWWIVPTGAVQVQLAPILFPTSGTCLSKKLAFIEPPATSETLANLTSSLWPGGTHAYLAAGRPAYVGTQGASIGLYEWDGTTTFVPNSTRKDCRLKVTLTTDNAGYTPTFYWGMVVYPQQNANTNATESYDASLYVKRATLSVPEDPKGVALDITFRAPDDLDTHVAGIASGLCRPMLAKLGTKYLVDGVTGDVDRTYPLTDGSSEVSLAIHDRLKLLENYVFTDRVPLGGLLLTDALEFLARRSGSTTFDFSTSTFAIPFGSGGDASDMGMTIEPGDNALDWFARLIETFAADWTWGERPTASGTELFAQSETDLGTTPIITLYETTADAVTDGVAAADIPDLLVRHLRREILEPLANDVRITGLNARTGRPIQAWKEDAASKTPTTLPSSRPANWLGFIKRYALIDPALRTQEAVNWACDTIHTRVSEAPETIEFQSTLLHIADVTLWRGDPLRIYGRGIYRIISFGGEFIREVTSLQSREFTYVAKKVAEEPPPE